MDPKKQLMLGALGLLALAVIAGLLIKRNTGDSPVEETPSSGAVTLPDVNKTELTEVVITRPGSATQPVTLTKRGETWRVTSPVDYAADMTAVTTMLDKLDELEVVDGMITSQARFHEEMELDDAHALHVVAKAGTRTVVDLLVGAYRSNNTLVRLAGQNNVASVEGSIKYAFDRDVKDWRDKLIQAVPQEQISRIEFSGEVADGHGNFVFERPLVAAPAAEGDAGADAGGPTFGDWRLVSANYLPAAPAEGAGADAGTKAPRRPRGPQTTVANFAASRLESVLATLADLRCSDFAAAEVTQERAGITATSPRVTLTANGQRHTLTVGSGLGSEYYVMKEGNPTIFLVTNYVRDRIQPTVDLFVQDPTTAANTAPPPPAPGGMPGGMQGMEGLPPEVMRQLQAQMAAQGH